ncbi:MFS transporter [Nocardiopsis ansamitocini]|uniref:Major facilitator superfamily (MFS) profile domain-containing protein n=1 Tax=Nocardiopsis ansamitocini TaxID=1670832 RepID=A0A9W6P4G0_9ACTN|nr:MFS transporter [Nocardiopsis ansamitocini]GLU46838.1 hypothetical protein Nans01_11890 [Nocardiopsis ansamitocini]
MANSTTAVDRRARIAGYGVFLVTGLLFATLVTRIPALQDRFALGEGQLTVVLALVPVVAGVGSAVAGVLSPRVGSAALLRVAQPALALAIVGVGAAPGLPWLYTANFCVGLLLGVVDAAMNMQAVAVERAYRRSMVTGFHGVWSVGAILGSLWAAFTAGLAPTGALGMFAGAGPGLAGAFAVVAGIGVLVNLAAGPLLYRGRAVPQAASGGCPAPRVPWRPIIVIGTALAIVYIADSAVSTWSAVFMTGALAAGALAPLAYGAYQVTTVLGRAVGDFMIRRYGAPSVVRTGAVLAVLGLFAIVSASRPWPALVGFALAGLGASVIVPTSFSAAGALDPHGTGVAVARVNIFNYVGFVVGAILIGTVAELADLRAAFAVPMLLLLVVVPLAPRFSPSPLRASRDEG